MDHKYYYNVITARGSKLVNFGIFNYHLSLKDEGKEIRTRLFRCIGDATKFMLKPRLQVHQLVPRQWYTRIKSFIISINYCTLIIIIIL